MQPFKEYKQKFCVNQEQVVKFAEATGDFNPIHLDEDFAAQSQFGKRIMHGYLGASIFSKIFGTDYPGDGTIYLKQNLTFLSPMFADERYTAVIELIEVFPDKSRAKYATKVFDEQGKIMIEGDALIKNKIFGNKQ